MKIGIMGAMPDEVRKIKEQMIICSITDIADRKYYAGKLYNHEVVLAFSRWGKVAASVTAATLINKYNVDYIIFTGVAGGVANELHIGDVVIGDEFYQYDMDARPLFSKFQIPLTETIFFSPDINDIKIAKNAIESFTTSIKKYIPPSLLEKFSIITPKVYVGVIASGDQFISNAITHPDLNIENKKVLAVEMEGAAVAQVCDEHKIPYIIIRIISDKADHSASIDFQAFVSEVASGYSGYVVGNILKNLIN